MLCALGVCIVSLAYTIATYVASDRLTSKTRRVILPAYASLMGWYTCIVISRIVALTLFTHTFGYYVLILLFCHWLLSVFGILNQRGQFCIDYAQKPPKQRWGLEVPFSLFAACLYQFVYFSLHEGKTRYAVSVYLVVTLIENGIMVALFFSEYSSLWYAPASVAVVIGLFLLGVLLLVIYYLVLHPDKTEDWYWIGVPRRCCQFPRRKGKSYCPRSVEISQPTLVNMNGQATNIQSRMTGLQPLTSILSRNKTTGQMQLMIPPPVIESGLSSHETDFYKKPRICAPQQSSPRISLSEPQSQLSSRHITPNSSHILMVPQSHNRMAPVSHTQSPSSNFSSERMSIGETHRVELLKIPTNVSLASSGRTESDDVELPETVTTESLPPVDSYLQMPSQLSMGLHMDTQLETAFHVAPLEFQNQKLWDTTNTNFADHSHDHDIDSPLNSPLDKARADAVTLKETETILEVNQVDGEEGRYSVSPPNLPTPDFTDESLLPGQPSQSYNPSCHHTGDQQDSLQHHQLHTHHQRQPHTGSSQPSFSLGPPQKIPLPSVVPPQNLPPTTPTAVQNGTATRQSQSSSAQFSMFQGIPAKQDYHMRPSSLERHYFPEPSSTSTPNLPTVDKGAKIDTGGPENLIRGQSESLTRHRSLPPEENINPPPQAPQGGHSIQGGSKNFPPPSPVKHDRRVTLGVPPANYVPEYNRGHQHTSPKTRRGSRGRGRGGGGNKTQKNDQKTSQQSHYVYTSPSKPPPRPNIARPHSFHIPQVAPENRQRLFGRTLPAGTVAVGNPVYKSPWQQQRRTTLPALIPVPPAQKPRRSPDRSRERVQFQTDVSQTAMRPRSYSEGTTLESSSSEERRKSNPSGPPDSQNLAPPFSPHYLGRSPGAPRRDQPNYYTPQDRTQVLNLTWTSPRLHHDPAISGQSHLRSKKTSYDHSSRGNRSSNRPPPPFLKDRSKTSYEFGTSTAPDFSNGGKFNSGRANFNPPRNFSNPLQPGGSGGALQFSAAPPGARRLSTNQNPGKSNPLLHVPSRGGHTSRV